jgi:acid phosphatase family membrane protein YuiD
MTFQTFWIEFGRHVGDFFTNPVLLCGIFSWFLAQIIKLFTSPKYRKGIDFLRFAFGSGGMPSSHSAVVCATAFSCGILYGYGSAVFAVAAVLAIVVMRDASGIRLEASKHAEVINDISQELAKKQKKFSDITLSEFLGHTLSQVIAGALLGVLMAFVCQLWLFPLFLTV